MATPIRQRTDTLAAPVAQSFERVHLPPHFIKKLYELLSPEDIASVTVLSKRYLEVMSAQPYWKPLYTRRFWKNPLPLSLTHFQAQGPQWKRVFDFFNYTVITPLGILYKKTALGGVKLNEFNRLPANVQAELNKIEGKLPKAASEKCAKIAAHIKEKMQKMPLEKQNLVYWSLSFLFYKYSRKRMELKGVIPSEFEFFGRRNVLFNPLRLIDAVEVLSESKLLFRDDFTLCQRFSRAKSFIESKRENAPDQTPSQENFIEQFGIKEAFPFYNLVKAGDVDERLSSSDSEDSDTYDTMATASFEEIV